MKKANTGLVFLIVALQACGDSTSSKDPSRVVISPFLHLMSSVGETVQYSATLEDQNGDAIEGSVFTWSTSDPEVASITQTGFLTGHKAGSITVRATSENIGGNANLTIDPIPDELKITSGDGQSGTLNQVLPENPKVQVLDALGNPVVGKFVSFSIVAGGGTTSPWQSQTGPDGFASTVWKLGCSNENPQRMDARVGPLTVSFTANVDLDALAICDDFVPQGRETQAYSTYLEVAGGDQGSVNWSVSGGQIPPGLNLQPSGELSGIPTLAGLFQFQARVQDALGGSASADYELQVCEGPLQLGVGEKRAFSPPGPDECGFFLPSGDEGDRYRFAVIYTRSDTASADVPSVTVEMVREAGGLPMTGPSKFRAPETGALGPRITALGSTALRGALSTRKRTEDFHNQIRVAERELLKNLGPNARPLPDQRGPARVSGPLKVSPDKVSFTNAVDGFTSCDVKETVRAIKIRENDLMVIYQDSVQRASDPLSEGIAQQMLDFYKANGKDVIDAYFDGVTDINSDGKIVVFVTPVVDEGVAAFVWSGDFFPKTSQPGWGACPASNEMEMMRFNLGTAKGISSGNFQAFGTLVHEAKHISSLYRGIFRKEYQPLWVEEGTAEIAKELASRQGWADEGGPAVDAMVFGQDVEEFTPENYGIILVHAGTTGYLASQPNAVVVNPSGARSDHSVYGSGWHFHRWLGDAYGVPDQPKGDSALFRALNDSLTAAGTEGVLQVTGAPSWASVLEDYVSAVMENGTGLPLGARSFTSYDFRSMNRSFTYTGKPDGDYPWPVNASGSGAFISTSNIGPIGASGIRVFDLTSDGTGLGLDVKVQTSGGVFPFRIVLIRVK